MMMPARIAALALLFTASTFQYERPVQLATDAAPETCIALPVDLLSHAAPGLEDLRLMAGDRAVAYRLLTWGEAATEHARPEQILNLGERDGVLSFDVEMTEPRYDQVLLRIARSHFSVLLHVSGANRAGESGVEFPEIAYSSDETAGDAQQRLITLPDSSFRYLHFDIKTLALDPLTPQDIAGVEVLSEGVAPPMYVPVSVADAPVQEPHATVYRFNVPANVPVERLSFASDDVWAVFARSATLERMRVPASQGSVRTLPEDALRSESIMIEHAPAKSRVPTGDAYFETTPGSSIDGIEAMPHPSILRLTIENGDDAPLAIRGLTLEMRERQLCFLRKSGMDYVLRYGNASLGAPRYDLTPIEAAAAMASVSTLGEERLLLPGVAEQVLPFTERHPVMLWIALVLVVGTLGFVAVRSAVKGQGSGNRE